MSAKRVRHLQGFARVTLFPLPSSSRARGIIMAYSRWKQTQLSLRSPFLDNDLVRTVFRAPESALSSNRDSLRLIADGNRSLLRIPTDRGLAGKRGTSSEQSSRRFLEFQFKAEYAYDMGMPQWVAKVDHAFSAFHLERLFLGRHKVFHFRVWYRDALAGYVREMLLDPRSLGRPYIERKRLEEVVRATSRAIETTPPKSIRFLPLRFCNNCL